MSDRHRAFLRLALVILLVTGISSCQSHSRNVLRWGGDQEGGGPYIFSPPDKPDLLTGFEVDLMDALAARGQRRAEFKQCQWDKLPDLLRIRGIDCIVNGYELTPERLQNQICTIPYYVNELQLIARRDDKSLPSWDDLRARPGRRKKRVGVLLQTAAERYLQANYADDVEIVSYDGTTMAMDHVADGQLDATLTDYVAEVFYRERYPKLHAIGPTVGRGYFVIYLRRGDEALRDELNTGIRAMIADGSLRRIYEKYGIWYKPQEELATDQVQRAAEDMQPAPDVSRWAVVWRNLPLLLKAASMTIKLSLASMPLAILIGILVAVGRLYGPWILRWPLTLYVEIIRGTPLLLQLCFLFFVLPSIVPIPESLREHFAMITAVTGLAVNYGAYEAEIYRAGILAIPAGQMEAALSLGMSRWQALWHVVLPQAVRLVVPPVTNDFIALFKDTAVCSVITVVELTKQYSILAGNTGAVIEFAAVTAVLYLAMSYPLALLTRRLEKKRARVIA